MTGSSNVGRGKPGRGLALSRPNANTLRVAYDDGTAPMDFTLAGLNPRGAWAATTVYAISDTFTQGGSTYRVTAAHTSPAVFAFDGSKMEILAAAGAAAADPAITTGLTGGTNGCLVYLSGPGVVRDLDPSMVSRFYGTPKFLKMADGTYRKLTGFDIIGMSGLTVKYAMVLKQKTTPSDVNVAYYNPDSDAYSTTYKETVFKVYYEPARVMSATTLLPNNSPFNVRFGDTSATPAVTVQDKIIIGGSAGQYGNLAAIPTTKWAQPWNPMDNISYGDSNTQHSPSGGLLEFKASNGLAAVTNVATGTAPDGGLQVVVIKNDGNLSDAYVLGRVSGTAAAPVAVGVRFRYNSNAALRGFSIGYFNGSGVWVDCNDALLGGPGQVADPTLVNGVGYRCLLDFAGSFIGARIFKVNDPEPTDYTIWGAQTAVLGAGGMGIASAGGQFDITDFGSYTAAPSVAPRVG